jgi:hypothetical protein
MGSRVGTGTRSSRANAIPLPIVIGLWFVAQFQKLATLGAIVRARQKLGWLWHRWISVSVYVFVAVVDSLLAYTYVISIEGRRNFPLEARYQRLLVRYCACHNGAQNSKGTDLRNEGCICDGGWGQPGLPAWPRLGLAWPKWCNAPCLCAWMKWVGSSPDRVCGHFGSRARGQLPPTAKLRTCLAAGCRRPGPYTEVKDMNWGARVYK